LSRRLALTDFIKLCTKIGGKPATPTFCSVEGDPAEVLKKLAQELESHSGAGIVSIYDPKKGWIELRIERNTVKDIEGEVPVADVYGFETLFESLRDELKHLSEWIRGADLTWIGFDVLTKGDFSDSIDVTNAGNTYAYRFSSKGEFKPNDIAALAEAFEDENLDELRESVAIEIKHALENLL